VDKEGSAEIMSTTVNRFKPGDIVAFLEIGNQVGCYNFSWQTSKELAEKQKAHYRQLRWEIIRIMDERQDIDGNDCLLLRRLDLVSGRKEVWSAGFMRKVTQDD